jgi:NADPH2:quinone reductase
MRAVVYERRGPARDVLKIVERPTPEPGPGEVRVKVAVSALNPTDIKARSEWLGQGAMPHPAVTPHRDGAGIIDKVGEGVDPARVGERVWVCLLRRDRAFGTAAEYVTAPESQVWHLPNEASFAEGASLPIPAITAYCALFRDEPIAGKTVLVHGGAGAVGFYAVQLAKGGGAGKVIATVSRNEQADKARQAGADVVVNYKSGDVIRNIEAAAGGPNAVHHIVEVNFGANAAVDAAVIANNGTIVAYGSDADPNPRIPFYVFMQKDVLFRMAILYTAPQALITRAGNDLARMLEQGRLQHQIAARLPLERIAEAHEMQESGRVIGKILIDVANLD